MNSIIGRNGFGNDSHTSLLLKCEGPEGYKSFLDNSYYGDKMVSYYDSFPIQLSSVQKKFGDTSVRLSSGFNLITTSNVIDTSSDFIIDFWVYLNSIPGTGFGTGKPVFGLREVS